MKLLRSTWLRAPAGLLPTLLVVALGVAFISALVLGVRAAGVEPSWVSAAADLAMAVGTVFAATWAVVSYRSAKKSEKSRWMKELFSEFFFNNNFDEIRDLLEFGYQSKLEPLLYQAALGRYNQIDTPEERRLIKELDNFLNYMEYVLYLEDNGQIGRSDVDVTFGYWISVLADDQHAFVRHYCENFGYERVFELVSKSKSTSHMQIPQIFAVYGSLLKGQPKHEEYGLSRRAKLRGPCRIPGTLLDLGEYPGLVAEAGTATVVGELYETLDPQLIAELDAYEEFFPENFGRCEYQRIVTPLSDPIVDAWVYYYIGPRDNFDRVPGNDWAANQRQISP